LPQRYYPTRALRAFDGRSQYLNSLGSDGQTGDFAYLLASNVGRIEHRHAAVGFFPLLKDYPA
jgi:hypothetical protein